MWLLKISLSLLKKLRVTQQILELSRLRPNEIVAKTKKMKKKKSNPDKFRIK